MLLGASGAGKSTLMRAILGTQAAGFPATSPGRTTTTATTVFCDPDSAHYQGRAEFHPRSLIKRLVHDNIRAASEAAKHGHAEREVRERLLTHASLDLRLSYIVNEEETRSWITQLQTGAELTGVVDAVLAHLEAQAAELGQGLLVFDRAGWPRAWGCTDSDQATFMAKLALVASNDWRRFGPLLSPLVSQIEISGLFTPSWGAGPIRLRLQDIEGLGQDAADTDAASSLTPEHLRRIEEADVVIVVDSAKQPYGRETREAFVGLIRSGNVHKTVVLHTKLDRAVDGVVVHDVHDVMQHIQSVAANMLAALEQRSDIPVQGVSQLRRRLAKWTYYAGYLGDRRIEDPGPQAVAHVDQADDAQEMSISELRRLTADLENACTGTRGRELLLIRQLHQGLPQPGSLKT